ncbi:MAG: hypothetical protein LBP59_06230 [Planctomycetaceae bacterium]|nr:hypothetical protein [Planctomycetaceae bacterium]
MYSTANERGYISTDFFVCLAAKCRRDARDPSVSPEFLWSVIRFLSTAYTD